MRYHQLGLLHHDAANAYPGYTLVTPIRHAMVFLVDMDGQEVHRWEFWRDAGLQGLSVARRPSSLFHLHRGGLSHPSHCIPGPSK